MDIPHWPETLPKLLADGYGYKRKTALARSQMDSGRERLRRRFKTTPTEIACRWAMTGEELTLFEGFVEHDLDGGALPFFAMLSTGQGLVPVRCHLAGEYEVGNETFNRWQVSVTLRTIEMPQIDTEQLLALKQPGFTSLVVPSLHYIAHIQLPIDAPWR